MSQAIPTNETILEELGALVGVLLRREVERDAAKGPDQPLDVRRLKDMAGLLRELLSMEREAHAGASRTITVTWEGGTDEASI